MPLSLEQAITQLDSGWLNHLQSQGYGGDTLRQAVLLALYAQQRAAARNGAGFKAALQRVNGWLTQPFACDNNGDYLFTAEWHDAGCSLSIDYGADPTNWRAEFRLPGHWPQSMDNLDLTDTRAVEHDFGQWLAHVLHWCSVRLLAQQVDGELSPAAKPSTHRVNDWQSFATLHPRQPVAQDDDGGEVRAPWAVCYPEAAVASLQTDFDEMTAMLLRLVGLLQAATHADVASSAS